MAMMEATITAPPLHVAIAHHRVCSTGRHIGPILPCMAGRHMVSLARILVCTASLDLAPAPLCTVGLDTAPALVECISHVRSTSLRLGRSTARKSASNILVAVMVVVLVDTADSPCQKMAA